MSIENMSIEEILASGDPNLIEQALSESSKVAIPSDDDSELKQAEEKQIDSSAQVPTTPAAVQTGEESVSSDANGAKGEPMVLAKDGVSVIPFSVLDGTRQKANALAKQLSEAQAKIAELEGSKSAIANTAVIDELREVSPEVAAAFEAMQNKLADSESRAAQALSPIQIQVEIAKAANPELIKWEKLEPEKYALAESIDEVLSTNPAYSNMTFTERFAEVVRLVKIETGELPTQPPAVDPLKAKAAEIVQRQLSESQALPKTLTEVGAQPSNAQRKQTDIWEEKSADQIAQDMMNMTPDQISQHLAGLF